MNKIIFTFLVVASISFLFAFSLLFITRENYFYYWDYVTNQIQLEHVYGSIIRNNPNLLIEIHDSITKGDYSLVNVLPLAPLRHILGGSRLAYILSIIIIYAIPVVFLFSYVYWKGYSYGKNYLSFFAALLACVFFPQLLTPVLRGYVDVVAFFPVFFLLALFVRKKTAGATEHIITGILIGILIITRRYFAYWAIAYFVLYVIPETRVNNYNRTSAINVTLRFLQAAAVVSIVCGLFLWFVGGQDLFDRLLSDYRYLYSAYKQSSSVWQQISNMYWYFGLPIVLFTLYSVVVWLRHGDRCKLFKILALGLLPIVLFWRIQDPGPQHYYLILPTLLIVNAFGMEFLFEKSRSTRFVPVVVGSILIINFLTTLGMIPNISGFSLMFNAEQHPPLVRRDTDEYRKFIVSLEQLIREEDGTVYVLASSHIVNEGIVRNACSMYASDKTTCQKIIRTHDVDARDGFPIHFFDASYIVHASPVQYHLSANDQEVIGRLHECVKNHLTDNRYYQEMSPVWNLDNGVKLQILKKEPVAVPAENIFEIMNKAI